MNVDQAATTDAVANRAEESPAETGTEPNGSVGFDRRRFLEWTGAGATASLVALAGCLGDENGGEEPGDDIMPEFPEIEDPPAAVYVPTHRESMETLEPVDAGEFRLAPMLSYPHPFWLVTDDQTERVDPDGGPGVHMMFTVWDPETGVVLPVDSGAEIRVSKEGETVGSPRAPWTMISQEMGFHFGDNVPLEDDGTYTVEVSLPGLSVARTGELAGRFAESATATFEFEYDQSFRQTVVGGVEYLDEDVWGERGALEPMDHGDHDHGDEHEHDDHADDHEDDHEHDDHADDHEDDHEHDDHADDHGHKHAHMPYSALPEPDSYPGTLLGEAESGDATFVVSLLEGETEPGDRLVESDEQYLIVSPRTPYNRVPLADMSLSATIEDDGSETDPISLEQTLDHELDLHYGAVLDTDTTQLEAGETLTITVDTPPQVARHQGYETAFLEMPSMELSVELEAENGE